MSAHAAYVGLGEAGDLVVSLPRALEVKGVEECLGIGFAVVQRIRLADECGPAGFWEVILGSLGGADHANVETLDPVSARRGGRLVPVIDRLVVDENRRLSRCVDEEAV